MWGCPVEPLTFTQLRPQPLVSPSPPTPSLHPLLSTPEGDPCHHHYGYVKMPKFSMTYPILRPRSVLTTFIQGYKWGWGEEVASGEGGRGWGGGWRMEIFFGLFFFNTNLSLNGSKNK